MLNYVFADNIHFSPLKNHEFAAKPSQCFTEAFTEDRAEEENQKRRRLKLWNRTYQIFSEYHLREGFILKKGKT